MRAPTPTRWVSRAPPAPVCPLYTGGGAGWSCPCLSLQKGERVNVAVKTCKKDCSPENKDKFLSEAGTPGGCFFLGFLCSTPYPVGHGGQPVGWLGWETWHGLSPSPLLGVALPLKRGAEQLEEGSHVLPHDVAFAPNTHFFGEGGEEKLLKACWEQVGTICAQKPMGPPALPGNSCCSLSVASWQGGPPAPLGAVWAPRGPPLFGVAEEVSPQC